jgi:glucosamine--fructose-6-phosphate aminotransferase (isomerizing)
MSQFAAFIGQINSLPALIAEQASRLEHPTRTLFTTPEIYGFRQIILTGSGDSFFAAAAAASAFRAWTGLPVQAMTTMEAARYMDIGSPPASVKARGLLVLAISHSGETARVVEATRRLRAVGGLTVAITARSEARLAMSADRMLDTQIVAFPSAPGTRSYIVSLVALYLIAIRIAEVRITMTMDEANILRKQIIGIGQAMEGLPERLAPVVEEKSSRWQGLRTYDVLGSGPSFASASYTAAKLLEAAGVHAIAQDVEEFHHLNYFVDTPEEVPTIVFVPSMAASASRGHELVDVLAQLGRPSVVITDKGSAEGDILHPAVPELFAPLVQAVPAALFAAYTARDRSATNFRGNTGPWIGSRNFGLVNNSPILTLGEQISC